MSMFSIDPANFSLSLTLGLTLGLSACQSLPKQPHLPESQALSARIHALYQAKNSKPSEQTDLVAAISEQNDIHPDLSGYHPIVTGANAFASRSILTGMATRNIDAQYYIWHNDQAGQLMLKDLWCFDRSIPPPPWVKN